MPTSLAIPHLVFLMVLFLFTFTVALLVFSHHLQHEANPIDSKVSFWCLGSVRSIIPPTSTDRVFHRGSSHLGPLFKTLQHFPLPTWLPIANKNWSWIQRLHKISWVNAVPTVGRQFDLNKEVRKLDDLLLVSYVTLGKLLKPLPASVSQLQWITPIMSSPTFFSWFFSASHLSVFPHACASAQNTLSPLVDSSSVIMVPQTLILGIIMVCHSFFFFFSFCIHLSKELQASCEQF